MKKIIKNIQNLFIFTLFSLILGGCSEKGLKNPNIVLIIGDDHGYPYFGFMDSKIVSTPHMDQIAKSGALFTNGFVPDNHCRPALQSLITGIDPYDFKNKRDSIKQ